MMMMMMNQRSLREGRKRPKRNHLRTEGPTRRNLLQFQQRSLQKGKSLGYLEVENLSGGGKVGTKVMFLDLHSDFCEITALIPAIVTFIF